jgi:hypothetical protein
MARCPYPEKIRDKNNGAEFENTQYLYWHEGYEAHKFELANLSIQLASLAIALDTEIREVKRLKRELEKQKSMLRAAKQLGGFFDR